MIPARDQVFVAFDTETTGLSPLEDRVIEIAALAFRGDGSEIAFYEDLVDPGVPIPEALTRIHGITDQMVRGKPRIDEVLPRFLEFGQGGVLIAHNAPYDVAMLMVPMQRLRTTGSAQGAGNLVLDTCAMARAAFPGSPNYRLGTMAGRLGIVHDRAHRAGSDVRVCAAILLKVLEGLGPRCDLEDLVRLNGGELYLGAPDDDVLLRLAGASMERMRALRDAVRTGETVAIEYRGGTKGAGPRLITPMAVMSQRRVAYVVAHCHLDRGLKNFRVDRIAAVRPAARA